MPAISAMTADDNVLFGSARCHQRQGKDATGSAGQ
jgi:hypothetical protein